jgi:hypothetical protein
VVTTGGTAVVGTWGGATVGLAGGRVAVGIALGGAWAPGLATGGSVLGMPVGAGTAAVGGSGVDEAAGITATRVGPPAAGADGAVTAIIRRPWPVSLSTRFTLASSTAAGGSAPAARRASSSTAILVSVCAR